jgi:hypothetical protein
MMIRAMLHLILLLSGGCLPLAAQVAIPWNSTPGAINLDSAGQPMDGGFTFELGVFNGLFVPTSGNMKLWVANWTGAASTSYMVATSRFAEVHTADSNDEPFVAGKATYVWGRRENAGGKEWILFRATNWNWPTAFPPGPTLAAWVANQATAVVGEINASGSPFMMKSAATPFSWTEWQAANLSNEPLDGPLDDPEKDGTPNLLEFVFATTPTVSNPPTPTPVTLQSGHTVITIPRRIDRLATLTIEVSGDLLNWQSGPAHTEILQDDATALVVRDLTLLSPANPKRFIRLKAKLP